MSEIKRGTKIAVVGAGKVGANVAYVMSITHACDDLVLIDINKDLAEGEAMDIIHGLPFLNQMTVRCGDYSDIKDADIIVMAAGAGRKPGETRLDLAVKNCKIAKSVTAEIMKHYNGGVILVVANPVDVITYKMIQWSGLPAERIVGSGTVLDGIRFRTALARKFGIDMKNIHAYILGEHGDTQFPSWSFSKIAGFSIDEFCKVAGHSLSDEEKEEIAQQTKTAGAEIIKRKGATFYGIGIAVDTLCQSLIHDENTIRTVGTLLKGEFGLNDVVLNVPCIVGANGIEKVLEVQLPADEQKKLEASAAKIKDILEVVKDI